MVLPSSMQCVSTFHKGITSEPTWYMWIITTCPFHVLTRISWAANGANTLIMHKSCCVVVCTDSNPFFLGHSWDGLEKRTLIRGVLATKGRHLPVHYFTLLSKLGSELPPSLFFFSFTSHGRLQTCFWNALLDWNSEADGVNKSQDPGGVDIACT